MKEPTEKEMFVADMLASNSNIQEYSVALPKEQLKLPYNKYVIIRHSVPKDRVVINYKGFPVIVRQVKIDANNVSLVTLTKPRKYAVSKEALQ